MNGNIMTFCAHNDDQLIGAGGTIKKYIDGGMKAYTYIFSYGESSHPHLKPEVIAKMREKESIKAARVIGDEIYYLGLKEGKFMEECDFKQLKKVIMEKKPVKIFTHSRNDPHPDHKVVFNIVKEVLKSLRYKGELYTFDVWNIFSFREDSAKLFVDISETFKYKIDALSKHKSQIMTFFTLGWNIYLKDVINGWNYGCRYAELFHKVNLK